MQTNCQMKKIALKAVSSTQLKKHSIKIQSICLSVWDSTFNVRTDNHAIDVCVQLSCSFCCCCCYFCIDDVLWWIHASLHTYMQSCDWNMQICPGKPCFFLSIFYLLFHIFWSFLHLFKIHSLDTLSNHLHYSAIFCSFFFFFFVFVTVVVCCGNNTAKIFTWNN